MNPYHWLLFCSSYICRSVGWPLDTVFKDLFKLFKMALARLGLDFMTKIFNNMFLGRGRKLSWM